MRLYLFTGNRPMAVKTYERCVKYVVDDLGCPLSRETERMTEEMHLQGKGARKKNGYIIPPGGGNPG